MYASMNSITEVVSAQFPIKDKTPSRAGSPERERDQPKVRALALLLLCRSKKRV